MSFKLLGTLAHSFCALKSGEIFCNKLYVFLLRKNNFCKEKLTATAQNALPQKWTTRNRQKIIDSHRYVRIECLRIIIGQQLIIGALLLVAPGESNLIVSL
jgi:hypothetical protein